MSDFKPTLEIPETYSSMADSDFMSSDSEKSKDRGWIHIILFLATFVSTTLAGLYFLNLWRPFDPLTVTTFFMGFPYSVSVLAILGCHEFGHYFAATFHRIKTTLPYFIPLPPLNFGPVFGTMGAVIRIKEPIQNKNQLTDIGAYGPIAGFVVTLLVLIIGVATIPPIEYLYTIHPNLRFMTQIPDITNGASGTLLVFGDNLIFHLVTTIMLPYYIPMSEIYHYPLLLAGWIGIFMTSLNMLPFGQLDGGHVVYAVFGRKIHKIISWIVAIVCITAGSLSLLSQVKGLDLILGNGWIGWLIWGTVLLLFVRPFHPPVDETIRLDGKRKIVAWVSLIIFILCFTPIPFRIL